MSTKHLFKFVTLALSVTFLATLPLNSRADTYHWIGATSGTWDETTFTNWYNDTLDAVSGTLPGLVNNWTGNAGLTNTGNGTDYVTIGSGNNLVFTVRKYFLRGLTIESNASVTVSNGDRWGFVDYLRNHGTLIFGPGSSKQISAITGALDPRFEFTNSGTVLVTGAGASLTLAVTGTNTGGLIRVENGALLSNRGALGITGGTLSIGVSSTLTNDDSQTYNQTTFTLADVWFENQGHLDWSQVNGDQNKSITVSGGGFINTGTVNYLASGSHTSTNPKYYLDLTLSGAITATNSGVMTFRNVGGENPNINPATADREEYVRLVVNVSGTGSFTNSGRIEIYNSTSGSLAPNKNQYAAMTVSDGAKFSNSGTISVALGAETANDAQHYATLLINTDWTNDGVVIVDSASKTVAKASLNLNAKTYTQTGAAVLQLKNGGQLKAGAVNLSGGVLSVSGTNDILAANTVFGNSAIWELGALGDDVLNFSGNLDLGGATLSVSGQLDEGKYLLASLGGALTGTLNFSGLSSDFDYVLDSTEMGKLYLNITAIPEPTTWALLLTGATLLACLRRRR